MMGIVEGFYGPPWSWRDRLEVLQWSAARGLTDYMYAPKDDPKHRRAMARALRRGRARGLPFPRRRRRRPHRLRDLAGALDRRSAQPPIEPRSREGRPDRRSRRHPRRPVPRRPAARPDRDPGARQGAAHAGLADVAARPPRGAGVRSRCARRSTSARSRRLTSLPSPGCSRRRPVGWTGASVVNDEITGDEARARVDALGGRAPLLWDNVPVNDAVMSDRLFMGPLRGRSHRAAQRVLRLHGEPDGAATGIDAAARLDRGVVRRR